MNIEWKYNPNTKELILKFSPVEKNKFSDLLHVLNETVAKGEILEGEYDLNTPPKKDDENDPQ